MRRRPVLSCLAAMAAISAVSSLPAAAGGSQACSSSGQSLGVSRIVEIDTSTGALFGAISTQLREPRFLGPKEVVLTFDDGPLPAVTKSILDTLERFCTKATFYSVGRMAIAYPATVREIIARGHTIGTHTWSHPLNLKRLTLEKARDEIEKGHAAVTMAAGQPVAPFFRFPGLSDSGPLLKHLQERGIAAFTVDVVSNDSYISDADRLLQRAVREVESQNGGIVLFHDIKAATARMLPRFLAELEARGYKVVHIRPKGSVAPVTDFDSVLVPMLVRSEKDAKFQPLMPFYGRVHPGTPEQAGEAVPPVASLAPAARERDASPAKAKVAARKPATAVRGWNSADDGTLAEVAAPAAAARAPREHPAEHRRARVPTVNPDPVPGGF